MVALFVLFLLLWFIGSVIAFVNSLQQGTRIKALEHELLKLRNELKNIIHSRQEPFKQAEFQKKTEEQTEPVKSEVPKPGPEYIEPEPSKSVIVENTEPINRTWESQQKIYTPAPSRTSAEWEALIGGKILNRIGALALIIGVGFFLKYAFDNNWITETMRVIIGFILGAALLFCGHYYKNKNFQIFSQGLVSAGIAILYLSVYSSFNYYHLVTQAGAIGMMSVVTIITFWQAFKYDSLVIGLFGWIGGFLTPFLISTGRANELGLFLYIAILDAGLLFIILKKEKWSILEPLALVGTIVVYCAWYVVDYGEEKLFLTSFFLLIFWALFLALELFRIVRPSRKIQLLNQAVSLVNGAFFFIALYNILDYSYHIWMGITTVLIAFVYFLIYLLIKKKRSGDEWLLLRYLLSTILLTVIAAGIQFDKFEITIAWAIESLALSALALRYKNKIVLFSSLVVLILAVFKFITSPNVFNIEPEQFRFIFNMRALGLLSMLVSACGTWYFAKNLDNKKSKEINAGLIYLCAAFLFTLITTETSDYFNQVAYINTLPWNIFYRSNLIFVNAIEWTLLGMIFVRLGLKSYITQVYYSGFFLTGMAVLFCATNGFDIYSPMELFIPVINLRSAAIIFLAICIFIQSRWIEKIILQKWFSKAGNIMRIVLVSLIFIFLTVETRDLFEQKLYNLGIDDTELNISLRNNFENQEQLFISGIWLFYSMLLMVIGIYRSRLNVRLTAIVVFGITIAKVFFYDLSYLDTLHRIYSFIGLGVILLLVSYLYQKYKYLILKSG